jgi:hypothetical protein
MYALETEFASMFALYRFMIGLIRPGTLFLNENLIPRAKKTVFNA